MYWHFGMKQINSLIMFHTKRPLFHNPHIRTVVYVESVDTHVITDEFGEHIFLLGFLQHAATRVQTMDISITLFVQL